MESSIFLCENKRIDTQRFINTLHVESAPIIMPGSRYKTGGILSELGKIDLTIDCKNGFAVLWIGLNFSAQCAAQRVGYCFLLMCNAPMLEIKM